MQISPTGRASQIQFRLPAQALHGLVLKQGETLQATVRQSDPSGQLTLEISGKLLQAISTLRLAAGMTLQLRVEKSNDGVILMLDEPQQKQLLYQQALRQNLPRQESLQPLFQRLAQGQPMAGKSPPQRAPTIETKGAAETRIHSSNQTTSAELSSAQLPRQVNQAISRLLNLLPTLQQLLKPDGLQQAIAHSGLFLENHLLQGASTRELNSDIKTTLLRLAQTIRQHLDDGKPQTTAQTREQSKEGLRGLLRQIEAGVARIQSNQISALTNRGESNERFNIHLELPLFNPQQSEVDVLKIRIHREGKRSDNSGARWSVTLHLSPEGYGDIHAIVTLNSGKIATTFWCEEEKTAQLFREQLHHLQERLAEQGLETGQCSSRCGSPPVEVVELASQLNGLIDTQA